MAIVTAHDTVVGAVKEIEAVIELCATPRKCVVAGSTVARNPGPLMTRVARVLVICLVTTFTLGRRITVVPSGMATFATDRAVSAVKDKTCLNMKEHWWNPA